MNIVCCIKQVPDTATVIKIDPEGKHIQREGITYIVSPYDEFAVEEALRIKEKLGDATVSVITMGPERAKEALRQCFAMGADQGYHLVDDAFDDSDTYATAKALAAGLKKIGYDLIICGKHAVDGDTSQVGAQIAEALDIPQVSMIMKQEISDDKQTAIVNRQLEGGEEVLEVQLPCLWTCQKGLNEPRYPTLKGIMGAKKKSITDFSAADLELSPDEVGLQGSKTDVSRMYPPPPRPAGRVLEGETQEVVQELVKLLREEANVI
jgi:electron transfer flavoprotein beta subunit